MAINVHTGRNWSDSLAEAVLIGGAVGAVAGGITASIVGAIGSSSKSVLVATSEGTASDAAAGIIPNSLDDFFIKMAGKVVLGGLCAIGGFAVAAYLTPATGGVSWSAAAYGVGAAGGCSYLAL